MEHQGDSDAFGMVSKGVEKRQAKLEIRRRIETI